LVRSSITILPLIQSFFKSFFFKTFVNLDLFKDPFAFRVNISEILIVFRVGVVT
jgi:hypothetical protein